MNLEYVDKFGQINIGDLVLVKDAKGETEPFVVDDIVNPKTKHEEIILDSQTNKYFITDMYVNGKSWVKSCKIVENGKMPDIPAKRLSDIVCPSLQEGYTLEVHLEDGAGWITVSTVGVENVLPDDFFADEFDFDKQVIMAIEFANKLPSFDELGEISEKNNHGDEGLKAIGQAILDAAG